MITPDAQQSPILSNQQYGASFTFNLPSLSDLGLIKHDQQPWSHLRDRSSSQTTHTVPRTLSPGSRSSPIDATRSLSVYHLAPLQSTVGSAYSSARTPDNASSSVLTPAQAKDFTRHEEKRNAYHLNPPTTLSTQLRPSSASSVHAPSTSEGRSSQSPASRYEVLAKRPPLQVRIPKLPSLGSTANRGQLDSIPSTGHAQPALCLSEGRRFIQRTGVYASPTPTANWCSSPTAVTVRREGVRPVGKVKARPQDVTFSTNSTSLCFSISRAEQTPAAADFNIPMPPLSTGTMPREDDCAFIGLDCVTESSTTTKTKSLRSSTASTRVFPGHSDSLSMRLDPIAGSTQLPVDVRTASRVADEKRRRSARASARFRQRRRDKEREAASLLRSSNSR